MIIKLLFLISLTLFLSGCGGGADSDSSGATPIPKSNTAPIAKISVDQNQTIYAGDEFIFSAGESHDADKDQLTYQWSLVDSDNQSMSLTNASEQNVTVTFPDEGEYTLSLVVNDGKVNSTIVAYNVNVVKATVEVMAKAGPDKTAKLGALIKLDGKSSYVLEGMISYQWSFAEKPEQSNAVLRNTNAAESDFIADLAGVYRLHLVVSNSQGLQSSDEVSVEVTEHSENSSPNAVISVTSKEVLVSEVLNLSARESNDVDGDILTYLWDVVVQPSNANSELNNYRTVDAEFLADTIGEYEIQLAVSDGEVWSTTNIDINVVEANRAPIANAGQDQIIVLGQRAQLSAMASYDLDEQALQYRWSLIQKPTDSLIELAVTDQETVMVELDVEGEYVFSLIVNDGQVDSSPSQVRITVSADQKPVAKIKVNTAVYLNEEVILDATESHDAEGATLDYQWQWVSQAAEVGLTNPESKVASFTPLVAGEYVIQLVVNDGVSDSDPVQVSISAKQNLPPIVHIAGESQRSVEFGSEVKLDASSSSDPEEGILSYAWSMTKPDLSNDDLTSTTDAITTFTPNVFGTYIVSLSVSDDAGNTETKEIVITVSLNDVSWIGTVNGRIVDTFGRGVSTIELYSGEAITEGPLLGYFYTDDNGYFQTRIGAGEDRKFSIMGMSSPFTFADIVTDQAVTSNNFTVDLGTKVALLEQTVLMNLTACEGYTGPLELKLDFNSPDFALFAGELDQKITKSQTLTIGQSSEFSLIAPFLYRVEVDSTQPIWIKDIDASPYPARQEWQVDLNINPDDVIEKQFEVCHTPRR